MLYHKTFPTYDNYIAVQGAKINSGTHDFKTLHPTKIEGFRKIFSEAKPFLNPGNILCLGARAGWEVIGAQEAGFVGSIGIDLHPGNDSVIKGDWHSIPFTDGIFENAFTNSIDHCLDLPKMVSEVRRVLVPGGVLFLMATNRKEWSTTPIEKRMAKGLEALFWDHPNDLLPDFIEGGFKLINTYEQYKWCYYFLRRDNNGH